ncbi:fimbrial protein [Pseudomonas chlororaphis]
MRSTTKKKKHTIITPLCTIALVVVAASPFERAAAALINVFDQSLSIPQNTTDGSILARQYITPMQACGKSECSFNKLVNYPDGGFWSSRGPTVKTNVSGISTRLLVNGKAYATGVYSPITFSQPLEVQLLSDGRPNLGGRLTTGSGFYTLELPETGIYATIQLSGTVTPITGTCSVPSQTVILPKGLLNKLGNVGSTIGMKNFQVKINNCPKGYNRIGYLLEPVGGVIENAPGVLPLTGGSTASGVNIQITDDKGNPATLGTSLTVDAYNKATGGSYAIPMQASYIRTDVTAAPGTVNGALNVFLDYR